MIFDAGQLGARQSYQLLIAALVPRPIAWVGTYAPNGGSNIAPFSFFGAVSSSPLLMMVSIGRRKGRRKDTAANLLHRHECVVHIPHEPLAASMVATSAEVGPEVDEFELAGLASVPADVVHAPRLKDAVVAFECRNTQHLELGSGPNDVFILEAVRVHIDDAVLGVDGLPDPARWAAVGRLGRDEYCAVTSTFSAPRPQL